MISPSFGGGVKGVVSSFGLVKGIVGQLSTHSILH